jgi:hypothetical protein
MTPFDLLELQRAMIVFQVRHVPQTYEKPSFDRRASMARTADRDPRHHIQKMQKELQKIKDHLREDIEKVDEPQLKAMFETAAEVLGGLMKAFRDYEEKNESAWRKAS